MPRPQHRRGSDPDRRGHGLRLFVEKLPSRRGNKRGWLWWSRTGAIEADIDRCCQCFLGRFDIEHTFRLLKQTLGWSELRLRSSEAAERWTWLVIVACAQLLRPSRPLATDFRRSWEKPTEPDKLTPARVRGVFGNLHAKTSRSRRGWMAPW